MNRTRLIFRNLWFHRKPYLAVLAGVVVSTAVLTGALVVGDSVRFSLQRLTDIRLGKIRYTLASDDRFFRQELAFELAQQADVLVAPALQAGGIAINSDKNLRINQVQVIGIDDRFGKFSDEPLPEPGPDEAIISRSVAEKLHLDLGDDLLLRIQKQVKAPSDAPFVSEKEPSAAIRVKVSAIAGDAQLGRFSLKSNQTAPYNIFLSLKQMASVLEIPGFANLLLAADDGARGSLVTFLDSTLKMNRKPADAGLIIRKLPPTNPARAVYEKYQITTDRIFFDDSTARAVMSAIPGCGSFLTYLVNSISSASKSTPYSFVTAASESFQGQPPGMREIIVNDWLATDLGVAPGDSVMLRYFLVGPMRSLRDDSARFAVKSVIAMNNGLSDPALMPDFPGMSRAGNCRDWETGAPVDLKKIRGKDEAYWKTYQGTPKAFISIGAGQQLWSNRFGKYTSFRFEAMKADLPQIGKSLMYELGKNHGGPSFNPVYMEGQQAASNSTDFGGLFLGLSFFILLSALLLTGMLFSMLARMRISETGILSAIGFKKKDILLILAGEAVAVVMTGAVIGIFTGILYNRLLISGLNTIWQDAVNTSLLVMKINMPTLLTGAMAGSIASLAVLVGMMWKYLRKPLSELVKGSYGIHNAGYGKTNRLIHQIIAATTIGGSLALLFLGVIQGRAMNSSLSLIAGGLLIPGGLALLSLYLTGRSNTTATDIPGGLQLMLRNLAMHRSRVIAAVALLSLGTFTIIITGANRKTFSGNETDRNSGTGGFLLWAESTIPVMNDLNSVHGAAAFGLKDEEALQQVRFTQLQRLDGDDASCLNLNQVSAPGLLGVPAGLFDRMNAFSFASLNAPVDETHPWQVLSTMLSPGVIAGFADQTVITYGLRKSVGDTLFYKDESGGVLKIILVGGLDNSIFQGNVVVSDSLLRMFYPSVGGSRIMLIDGPSNQCDAISGRLEELFRDYGMMVTPASARLASFNAVENTYLSVFMILGGMGIIIGTIGLGIVLLRNIAQRKQELALYMALGFRKRFIFKLIFAEHTFILVSGMLLGLASSLPVILPLLITPAFTVPWLFIAGILLIVFANGLLWIYFPAKKAMKSALLPALRQE